MAAAARHDAAPLSAPGTTGFHPVEQPEKPPFDFLADLLLVAALVPAAPIEATFPAVPLLRLKDRAPLLAWFSRVHESCYRAADGGVRCTRAEGAGAYAELTFLLPSRDGSFFVPRIEASSAMSQRLAQAYYGMPKALVSATVARHGAGLVAQVAQSNLQARRLGGGALLTAVARARLPRWSWQARFPSGGRVRARLPWIERAAGVRVSEVHLAPQPPWLPEPAEPFRFGLLVEGARMRLLPPDAMAMRVQPGGRRERQE